MKPKFLIIGQGSMGKRRVRCLRANGVPAADIVVFDTQPDRLQESREKYSIATTSDVDSALRDPEIGAVIVSVPGFLHMKYCLAAVRAGKHWFSEVPMAVSLEGIGELKALTRQKGLVGAPGCQELLQPLWIAAKAWATGPLGSPILSASYAMGSYLPDWHPYEDYRKFYASNRSMGGGNLDIIAQDLIWLRWVIDRPMVAVSCRSSKTSALEFAEGTPDHHEMIIEFEGGLMLSAHFDLVDRTHFQTVRMAAANSTLACSSQDSALQVYRADTQKWERTPRPENYDGEAVYHEEIGKFLRCIERREPWLLSLEVAEEIVRLLLALETSERERRTVAIAKG